MNTALYKSQGFTTFVVMRIYYETHIAIVGVFGKMRAS